MSTQNFSIPGCGNGYWASSTSVTGLLPMLIAPVSLLWKLFPM